MQSSSYTTGEMAAQPDDKTIIEESETIRGCYNNLLGQEFSGMSLGKQTVENKQWDVIQVTPGDSFNEKLDKIVDIAQGKVWKGFTGPKDSYKRLPWNYWLFVNLYSHSFKEPTKFRIVTFNTFNIPPPNPPTPNPYELNIGYAIKVEAIEGQQ